jgi:hypothetical protein
MTAGQRTMTIVRCLLLAEVLLWAVLAVDLVLGRSGALGNGAPPPAPGGDRGAEDGGGATRPRPAPVAVRGADRRSDGEREAQRQSSV